RVIRNHVPNSCASLIARHTRARGARSITRFSIRSVLIVVLQPVHDALLFPTAERREIEQVVRVEQMVETALVGRVGVEDALVVPIRRETEHEVIDDELSLLAE